MPDLLNSIGVYMILFVILSSCRKQGLTLNCYGTYDVYEISYSSFSDHSFDTLDTVFGIDRHMECRYINQNDSTIISLQGERDSNTYDMDRDKSSHDKYIDVNSYVGNQVYLGNGEFDFTFYWIKKADRHEIILETLVFDHVGPKGHTPSTYHVRYTYKRIDHAGWVEIEIVKPFPYFDLLQIMNWHKKYSNFNLRKKP